MVYICKYCYKQYKSLQSRSNHYRLYHDLKSNPEALKSNPEALKSNPEALKSNPEALKSNPEITIETSNGYNFKCKHCVKTYKYKQGKYKHEKVCKNKDDINEDIISKDYKDDIVAEKNKDDIIAVLQKDIIELKNKFNEALKNSKIHPKTLQKINNNLINNTNINNGTINIIKFGTEDLSRIFTEAEMLKIYNRKMSSIEESIKTLHFNDMRPEYKNFYITSLRDQYAFIFDGNKFITVLKDDLVEELINNHFDNIECSLGEYKNKLDPRTLAVLEKFINMMNNDDIKFIDHQHKKLYTDFRSFNKTQLKLLIYNISERKAHIINW